MAISEMHSGIHRRDGVNHARFIARNFLRHRLYRPIVFAFGISNYYIQCAGQIGLRLCGECPRGSQCICVSLRMVTNVLLGWRALDFRFACNRLCNEGCIHGVVSDGFRGRLRQVPYHPSVDRQHALTHRQLELTRQVLKLPPAISVWA